MAAAPKHACQWGGCPALLGGIDRYCPRHAPRMQAVTVERKADAEAAYNALPETRESRAFLNSAAWQRLRREQLHDHPFCADCAKKGIVALAHDVHHIQSRATRPDLASEITNLESLCVPCHSTITATERNQPCHL